MHDFFFNEHMSSSNIEKPCVLFCGFQITFKNDMNLEFLGSCRGVFSSICFTSITVGTILTQLLFYSNYLGVNMTLYSTSESVAQKL